MAYTPPCSWFYCPGGRAYTVLHCFAAVLYCHSKRATFFPALSSLGPLDCANEPHVAAVCGRSTSTCQHGELTAEKPIIHRYVAKNITAIFSKNRLEYAPRLDLVEAKVSSILDFSSVANRSLGERSTYDVPIFKFLTCHAPEFGDRSRKTKKNNKARMNRSEIRVRPSP